MGPRVEALVRRNPGTRLLIVDIDSWGSPVAKQHGIRSIPALWLFDGRQRVTTNTGQVLQALQDL